MLMLYIECKQQTSFREPTWTNKALAENKNITVHHVSRIKKRKEVLDFVFLSSRDIQEYLLFVMMINVSVIYAGSYAEPLLSPNDLTIVWGQVRRGKKEEKKEKRLSCESRSNKDIFRSITLWRLPLPSPPTSCRSRLRQPSASCSNSPSPEAFLGAEEVRRH